ncbi:MAG TPA: hypothetical protein VIM53_04930 [Candidatus Saccharimonadales bacterium]
MTKRRWLLGFMALAVGTLSLGASAAAATTPEVMGTVTFNGAAAANAAVSISCTAAGGGQHIRNVTASSTGRYNASFVAGQCDDGATVTVVATSSDGTNSGQATSTMGAGGTSQRVEVDIALAAPVPLPEFIPLTLVLAMIASAGIVKLIRRKEFERPPPIKR